MKTTKLDPLRDETKIFEKQKRNILVYKCGHGCIVNLNTWNEMSFQSVVTTKRRKLRRGSCRHLSRLLCILTSAWVLRTPNAGKNGHFQRFFCKKAIKARNLQQIFAKNSFFWVCTQTLVDCFIPKKMSFFEIYNTRWFSTFGKCATTNWQDLFYCDHLPVFVGILVFRFPGLETYLMSATASYSFEGLVAEALFETFLRTMAGYQLRCILFLCFFIRCSIFTFILKYSEQPGFSISQLPLLQTKNYILSL